MNSNEQQRTSVEYSYQDFIKLVDGPLSSFGPCPLSTKPNNPNFSFTRGTREA
jgi:hypothetical protein